MGKIHVIDRDGGEHELEIDNGLTLMEPLRNLSSGGIEALCGGMCSCATCHVFVQAPHFEKLDERQDDELELLEGTDEAAQPVWMSPTHVLPVPHRHRPARRGRATPRDHPRDRPQSRHAALGGHGPQGAGAAACCAG